MKTQISLLLILIFSQTILCEKSSGCGKSTSLKLGKEVERTISVSDSHFTKTRTYRIYLPKGYNSNTAYPSLYFYHGQYGDDTEHSNNYDTLSDTYGYISIFPQAYADYRKENNKGWNAFNTGDYGDTKTCNTKNTQAYCYESCSSLSRCTGCSWSSCVDDVEFQKTLIKELEKEFCFETEERFITGESNGGMLTHWIVDNLPGTFLGAFPVYGLPLIGYNKVTQAHAGTSILQFHGRSDKVIPHDGGWDSYNSYLYEYIGVVYGSWASAHGCQNSTQTITTPYDGNKNLACEQYKGCSTGQVIRCLWNGGHGADPSYTQDITWWFMENQRSIYREEQNAKQNLFMN